LDISDGDSSLVGELFNLFKSTTPAIIAELSTAVSLGHHRTTSRLAHRLKGAAANMGAVRLSSFCADLEQETKREKSEIPQSSSVVVEQLFAESLSVLENWLKRN
jgi:HPt (histidine-containing phosphotransfer) domain-containing protein